MSFLIWVYCCVVTVLFIFAFVKLKYDQIRNRWAQSIWAKISLRDRIKLLTNWVIILLNPPEHLQSTKFFTQVSTYLANTTSQLWVLKQSLCISLSMVLKFSNPKCSKVSADFSPTVIHYINIQPFSWIVWQPRVGCQTKKTVWSGFFTFCLVM